MAEPRSNSEQSGLIYCLAIAHTGHMEKAQLPSYPLDASRDSNQTEWIIRLI